MTLFISQLDSKGKPKPNKTRCKKCYKIFTTQEGFNVHKAVHRVGPDSYHIKGEYVKSRRYA